MRVEHQGGDRFRIGVRQHTLEVDQPEDDGGTDVAATPTEMFVASLASCVAFYVRRYLSRHDLPTEGLVVTATFAMAQRPARVGDIAVQIDVPDGVPAERRPALLAVAGRCTVHNTLEQPPHVTVEVTA
ncbi:OsmC family protein [Acidiferrimicrobium sp. IK]|nr:OsmC family protein [Acidiferrimicrobium sp. IK]MCU4185239.1 OsmC family protein [Acidiferrimicrobium sp. IK]